MEIIKIYGDQKAVDFILNQGYSISLKYPNIRIQQVAEITPDCFVVYDLREYFKAGNEDKAYIHDDLKRKYSIPDNFNTSKIVNARIFKQQLEREFARVNYKQNT